MVDPETGSNSAVMYMYIAVQVLVVCRYEQSFEDMLKFQNADPSSNDTLRR